MVISSGWQIKTPSQSWLRLNWLPQPRRAAVAARFADSLYIAGTCITAIVGRIILHAQ